MRTLPVASRATWDVTWVVGTVGWLVDGATIETVDMGVVVPCGAT